MSEYHLGWGSPSWADYPGNFPLAIENRGTFEDFGGSWVYGVVPNGELPPGVTLEMSITLIPSDGGQPQTLPIPIEGDPKGVAWGSPLDFFRENEWNTAFGVYEITGFVNGVSCANKLVLVASPNDAYAVLSYYAEGGAPEAPAFWTAFQGAREER